VGGVSESVKTSKGGCKNEKLFIDRVRMIVNGNFDSFVSFATTTAKRAMKGAALGYR